MRWRGCDNSDGRLQIADDGYRVVGNRRPLQRHSERSEESQIMYYELLRFFVTSFLRMIGENSCHSERSVRISKKRIRFFVTSFLRMTWENSCHSERSEESRKNLNCNQTQRFAQGDKSNVILSGAKNLKLRITHYALRITHYALRITHY